VATNGHHVQTRLSFNIDLWNRFTVSGSVPNGKVVFSKVGSHWVDASNYCALVLAVVLVALYQSSGLRTATHGARYGGGCPGFGFVPEFLLPPRCDAGAMKPELVGIVGFVPKLEQKKSSVDVQKKWGSFKSSGEATVEILHWRLQLCKFTMVSGRYLYSTAPKR